LNTWLLCLGRLGMGDIIDWEHDRKGWVCTGYKHNQVKNVLTHDVMSSE